MILKLKDNPNVKNIKSGIVYYEDCWKHNDFVITPKGMPKILKSRMETIMSSLICEPVHIADDTWQSANYAIRLNLMYSFNEKQFNSYCKNYIKANSNGTVDFKKLRNNFSKFRLDEVNNLIATSAFDKSEIILMPIESLNIESILNKYTLLLYNPNKFNLTAKDIYDIYISMLINSGYIPIRTAITDKNDDTKIICNILSLIANLNYRLISNLTNISNMLSANLESNYKLSNLIHYLFGILTCLSNKAKYSILHIDNTRDLINILSDCLLDEIIIKALITNSTQRNIVEHIMLKLNSLLK